MDWKTAEKKPIKVKVAGPFRDTETVETIEGDFEVDEEYLEKHGGYYIIEGVQGERYPCAIDVFEETYRWCGC